MSTSKNKNKVQSDTKEDERRKLIENLDRTIKNLHNISDDVEYGLLKIQWGLYNISQKRTKNLKARVKKMIEEGNVEPLANGHDCLAAIPQTPNRTRTKAMAMVKVRELPPGLPYLRTFMTMSEHFAQFLCFFEDNAGR
ncbi:hypothetical protein ACHAPO_003928 [Fusarium lateritium]